MTEVFTPLGPAETIAAADRLFDEIDRALTIQRGLEKASARELVSIIIFVRQLHRIALAAAEFSVRGKDIDQWHALQAQLLVPGYLPLPINQESSNGEG